MENTDKPIKMYFKGGKGIPNPVDYNGNEIKEGDVLTHCYFDEDYLEFFKKFYPQWDEDKIFEVTHKPSVVVKWNPKGFYYGEGIEKELYMHDFRFKFAKIVPPKQLTTDNQ